MFTKEKIEERSSGPFPDEMKNNDKIIEMIEKRMTAQGPWPFGKIVKNR